MVKLFNGTYFEFGGVTRNTPEGKVLPVVRVRNRDGAYVIYAPRSMNQESGSMNSDDQTNNSEFIIHDSVVPKVEGNVISWEIASGITARYTMMEDRVKADYIINDKSNLKSDSLNFYFEYAGGNLEQGPNGNISLYNQNFVEGGGEVREIFTIPIPVITESGSQNHESWEGSYEISNNESGTASIAIVLPSDKLSKAQFPLIVDPIIIDQGVQGNVLEYGNARSMVEDAWGNQILVTSGWNYAKDTVWYKNFGSSEWVDAEVELNGSDYGYCRAARIASDIDSSGDIHVAAYFQETEGRCEINAGKPGGYTFYVRLNVVRGADGKISNVHVSDYQDMTRLMILVEVVMVVCLQLWLRIKEQVRVKKRWLYLMLHLIVL